MPILLPCGTHLSQSQHIDLKLAAVPHLFLLFFVNFTASSSSSAFSALSLVDVNCFSAFKLFYLIFMPLWRQHIQPIYEFYTSIYAYILMAVCNTFVCQLNAVCNIIYYQLNEWLNSARQIIGNSKQEKQQQQRVFGCKIENQIKTGKYT